MAEAAKKTEESKAWTLDDFLAEYPWPDELADKGQPMHWLWHFDLDATPEELWPHVSDTSRLNRSMGLSRMDIDERDGIAHGTATHGGLFHEWTEPPWEWEAARSLHVVRKYTRGWAHYVRSMYVLEDQGDFTRMHVYFGWVPRGAIGKLMLKLGMAALKDKYRVALGKVAELAKNSDSDVFRPPPPALAADVLARIDALSGELSAQGVGDDVVDHLVELIRGADDMELDKIQPRQLARRWKLDEREVLSGFLHATRIGLFDLSWDVVCPLCRGAREHVGALSEVPADGTCDVCNVDFSTEEDHVLEVSFRIHPSIRDVPKLFYCTAEPSKKLHIRVQTRVEPGQERKTLPKLGPGRYRLRFLEDGAAHRYVRVDDEGEAKLKIVGSGDDEVSCGCNPEIVLRNDLDEPRTFVIEGLGWGDDALLPEHLFNFQDFRDLFSSEYIGSDIRLSVGKQTLLFTDIVGSTRFYAEKGDPGAFVQVRDHFKVIYEIIKTNRGAVIKTIGDAVMASFSASVDALAASQAIHQVFDGKDGPITVRISLNAGPCIAVNWNNGIDYFGGTVNLAAKLQACAEACEIAMSESVYKAPGVSEFLEEQNAELQSLEFEIKALSKDVTVYRWSV